MKKTRLQFIPFSDLILWDVKSFFLSNNYFKKNIPLVFFGEFLSKRVVEKINIKDSGVYKILGVRSYGEGAYINRVIKGDTLKMRTYQLSEKNDLFWCKVDTKNGAFGVIKGELAGGIGSSNMFFAKIDIAKIDPSYLQIMFKSKKVNSYMDQFVTGTTNRKYIKPNQLFNEIRIPLPSLEVQNKIVVEYNKRINHSSEVEQKVKWCKNEIEKYLMEKLGIIITERKEKNLELQFIDYKSISEWGVNKIIGLAKYKTNKYEVYTLDNLSESYLDIKRGKSPEYSDDSNQIILNQKCNRWDEIDLQYAKTVKKQWFDKIDKDVLTRVGDVLINSTGEGTIGRASYIDKNRSGLLYDSHLLLLRLNLNIVNSKYYTLFFNCKLGQAQVDGIKSAQATKQTELGVANLKKISFPLPPLSVQEEIVEKVSSLKTEIKCLQKLVKEERAQAMENFEKEIFSD